MLQLLQSAAPLASGLLAIDTLDLDVSPQVRAALDAGVVEEYANLMRAGACFPPVVVFYDGATHRLADGRHRLAAARQIDLVTFECDVRRGTFDDALWYALGANREHGHRLTHSDKRHAIMLAITTWPTKGTNEIAAHVGVHQSSVHRVRHQVMRTHNLPERIVGRDGKSYPLTHRRLEPGQSPPQIRPPKARDKQAVAARLEQMRSMAEEGYSTRQIAQTLDLHQDTCRLHMKRAGIIARADAIVGGTRRANPNRIVEQMTMQAENLCDDTDLIDFSKLDAAKLPQWVRSLQQSRRAMTAFINQLKEHLI